MFHEGAKARPYLDSVAHVFGVNAAALDGSVWWSHSAAPKLARRSDDRSQSALANRSSMAC